MAVILQFHPHDHGRVVSDDDLSGAQFQPGFRYEVISGKLYVTRAADFHHDRFEKRLLRLLWDYADKNPEIVGWLTEKARVFGPGESATTAHRTDSLPGLEFSPDAKQS